MAALATLAACGSGGITGGGSASPYGTGDASLTSTPIGGGVIDPFLTNGTAILKALDTISAKSGKPMRVTTMNADQMNGITVDVQEPKKHVNVDEYKIANDGTLTGPFPVKMVSLGNGPVTAAQIDAEAFDPKQIGFARLARTAHEAIAKSHFPDARVTNWEIKTSDRGYDWFLYLDAARARPIANLRKNGTIEALQF